MPKWGLSVTRSSFWWSYRPNRRPESSPLPRCRLREKKLWSIQDSAQPAPALLSLLPVPTWPTPGSQRHHQAASVGSRSALLGAYRAARRLLLSKGKTRPSPLRRWLGPARLGRGEDQFETVVAPSLPMTHSRNSG